VIGRYFKGVCSWTADAWNQTMRRRSLRSFGDLPILTDGGEAAPVGRPDFKPGWDCRAVPGGFDSCSLPSRKQIELALSISVFFIQQCGLIDASPSRYWRYVQL